MKQTNYNKLFKYYKKILYKVLNIKLKSKTNFLVLFVDYLRYLRDYFMLTEDVVINGTNNIKLATIVAAIEEFDNYNMCIYKYYEVEPTTGAIKPIIESEDTLKQYNDEKRLHWDTFWGLVIANIKTWGNE